VPEHKLTAGARQVISAKEKSSKRVRINVAFESHRCTALNVQYYAIAIIGRRLNGFGADAGGQDKEISSIKPVKPWNAPAYLVSVNAATRDVLDLRRLAG
jgi:hypothetical protein